MFSGLLDVGGDSSDTNVGANYGNCTEKCGVWEEHLALVGELESHRDGGDEGDVLVGAAHHRWDHAVREEEWAENHSTGDSCASTEDGRNAAEESELADLLDIIESLVVGVEIVAIGELILLHFLDSLHAVDGHQEHHHSEGGEDGVSGPVWESRLGGLRAVQGLSGEKGDEAQADESHLVAGEVVFLLVVDGLELWNDLLVCLGFAVVVDQLGIGVDGALLAVLDLLGLLLLLQKLDGLLGGRVNGPGDRGSEHNDFSNL